MLFRLSAYHIRNLILNDLLLYAQLSHLKSRLVYTGGLRPSSQHIRFRRYVIFRADSLDFVEEAVAQISSSIIHAGEIAHTMARNP